MMFPTIHLNGTSREELIKNNTDSANLLRQTIDAMCRGRPHGRDYYPQNKSADLFDAYRKASAEYEARITKLTEVYLELLAINEYLQGE